MTRSLLQPIRTRRVISGGKPLLRDQDVNSSSLTPGTRKTIAAIGALWVSFAVTASGKSTAGASASPASAGAESTVAPAILR